MKLRFAALALFVLAASNVHAAPFPTISQDVGVCDPNNPTHCAAPDASGNLPVTGTFTATLGGFTPSTSGARGTPLSVTTSDSSGALPTGAVVAVTNVGSNPMYCNVNGIVATTSDQLITSGGGWFAFTIPNGVTTLHCIATGGSTTANTVGGSGLPTGTGGGSGGGGGGGAVFGPTAVGTAAANPPVLMGGTADGTATGAVAVSTIKAGNSAGTTDKAVVVADPNVLAAVQGAIPAGTNIIGKVGIDQTTPGTTNGVQINAAVPAGTNTIGFTSNDPCTQGTKLGAPINLTASGQVITGTASKKTYICSIDVVPAAAQNVALVEGTGTTCASNIFGLEGGTTAATGWNFQTGGGISRGSGAGTVVSPSADTNATAANVCLLLSGGAVQVSGHITYVQQ